MQSDLQMIFALRRFLESVGFPSLSVARNEQEAVLYLRGVGVYENRMKDPAPSILVLDSDSRDGCDLEVLAWVRTHPGYADVPVIFLCRDNNLNLRATSALDNHCFLVDRANFKELADALQVISQHEVIEA